MEGVPFRREGFLPINVYDLSHYKRFDVAVSCSSVLLVLQSALVHDAATDHQTVKDKESLRLDTFLYMYKFTTSATGNGESFFIFMNVFSPALSQQEMETSHVEVGLGVVRTKEESKCKLVYTASHQIGFWKRTNCTVEIQT